MYMAHKSETQSKEYGGANGKKIDDRRSINWRRIPGSCTTAIAQMKTRTLLSSVNLRDLRDRARKRYPSKLEMNGGPT